MPTKEQNAASAEVIRQHIELPVHEGEDPGGVIPWRDLQFILQGVELESIRYRKRYQRKRLVPA